MGPGKVAGDASNSSVEKVNLPSGRVNVEILAPSMKHGQEANRGAQMLGVRRDCQQGFGGCAKKDAVDCSGILQCQVGDLLRQCKHHVEVRFHRQQFRFSSREPFGASGSLALRTTPIGTCNGDLPITCIMVSIF
jgi:hypothetical protein